MAVSSDVRQGVEAAVYGLAYDSATGKSGTFIMTGGSIIGCAAQLGGGVYVAPECTFAMATGSNIHNCIANNDGGGVINHGTFQMHGGQSVHARQ